MTSTRSLKISADLNEIATLRSRQLGYPSVNAYLKALIRYDALVNGPHQITLALEGLKPKEQDGIDRELLENTRNGVSARGQFLGHFLEKLKDHSTSSKSRV